MRGENTPKTTTTSHKDESHRPHRSSAGGESWGQPHMQTRWLVISRRGRRIGRQQQSWPASAPFDRVPGDTCGGRHLASGPTTCVGTPTPRTTPDHAPTSQQGGRASRCAPPATIEPTQQPHNSHTTGRTGLTVRIWASSFIAANMVRRICDRTCIGRVIG